MTSYAALPASLLATPEAEAFWQHYQALRGSRQIPTLTNYLDQPLHRLQSFVGIGDILSETELDVRLFGMGLVEFFGRDVRGRTNYADFNEGIERLPPQLAWRAVKHPCGYLSRRHARHQSGAVREIEMISLPLEANSTGPRHIISLTTPGPLAGQILRTDAALKIMRLDFKGWIDLGAGIPDWTPGAA
jgi:hypothetical protein